MKRSEQVKKAVSVLSQIFDFKLTERYICSKIFIVHLRNHIFLDQLEKDDALRAYCHVVLNKKVRNKIFENKKLDMNLNHIAEEFSGSGPFEPKWYRQAMVKNEVSRVREEDSPLFKHLIV